MLRRVGSASDIDWGLVDAASFASIPESDTPVRISPRRPLSEVLIRRKPPSRSGGHSGWKDQGTTMPELRIKRVYEPRSQNDGRRVLVDRLWPRGLRKQDLEGVLWVRDVAPSAGLRKWFGHKPERWDEFRRRYFAELRSNPAVETIEELVRAGRTTLVYGAHDEVHNQAAALAEFLTAKRHRSEEER